MSKNRPMRLRLAASAIAVFVCVIVLVGVEFPALVDTIQNHIRQNWVLGALIAVMVFCVVVQWFWEFRRFLRVWAILAAYLILHFLIAVPALGRLGVIKYGTFGDIGLFLLAISEAAVVRFVMQRVTAPLPKPGR